MPSRFVGALAPGSLVAFAAGIAVAEDRAADLLAKKLTEFPGSERGQVMAITSQPLAAVFPNDQFYALRFRQYPLANDLRHTYASLLIAQGAHPKYIQAQLGHASIQTTLDRYGHLMPEMHEAEARKLDNLVFGEPRDVAVASPDGKD